MGALSPQAAYALWAPSYPAVAHNPLMCLEQQIVEPLLRRLPSRRSLDVGTGSGRYLPVLAATGATVVGVDLSMPMLGRCADAPWRRSRICADAARLPFPRAVFDVVNASLMVGDVADLDGWCAEIARVLRVGGHLVYSDFHPSWSANGWRRTFTAPNGATHDVAFAPHTIEQHLASLDRAGFDVAAIREPRLASPARGRSLRSLLHRWRDAPVVAVFHAVKACGWAR